ncbi:MAG: GNAT family N-acetyltransferase [Luteimonas sp.]
MAAATSAEGSLRVRPAAVGDASDVARLLDHLGYPCSNAEAAERIAIVMSDRRQHLLLAEVDGEACGLISLYTLYSLAHGSELARITSLVIAPEHARTGIGRLLLREVEQLSRHHGIQRIEITSNARRVDAHAFYRTCGYSDDSFRFVKMLCD